MARTTIYNEDIATEICERLASGEHLRDICTDEHMPGKSTVFTWLFHNTEFRELYARAREFWAEAQFDEIFAIASDGRSDTYIDTKTGALKTDHEVLGRSRLRVDTLKWGLSKLNKKYSDRSSMELTNPDGSLRNMNDDQITEKLNKIFAAATERMKQKHKGNKHDVSDLA